MPATSPVRDGPCWPSLLKCVVGLTYSRTQISHRVKLAREIAARTEPRFIEIEPERRTTLRRTNNWLFIDTPRERGGGRVPFTEEQLEAMRGGLTVEQYRRKTFRKWGKR